MPFELVQIEGVVQNVKVTKSKTNFQNLSLVSVMFPILERLHRVHKRESFEDLRSKQWIWIKWLEKAEVDQLLTALK